MGIDWNAIGNLAASLSGAYSQPGSPQAAYADRQAEAFRAQQQEAALKKAEKERKKKERGALGGKLGSTLGTIAGVALAPVTGGASLLIPAAAGAAGAAIGGTAGQAIAGGGFDPADTLRYAGQGAMSGLTAGIFQPTTAAAGAAGGAGKTAVAGGAGNAAAAGASGAPPLVPMSAGGGGGAGVAGVANTAEAAGGMGAAAQWLDKAPNYLKGYLRSKMLGVDSGALLGGGNSLFDFMDEGDDLLVAQRRQMEMRRGQGVHSYY